jgi:hypothetical protein
MLLRLFLVSSLLTFFVCHSTSHTRHFPREEADNSKPQDVCCFGILL